MKTFKKQAEIPDINGVNYENVRGMYSGNVFYLWINDNITSYDMTDGFKKIKEREWFLQNFPDSFIMTVYVPGGGMKISSPGNLCRIGNCELEKW